MRKFYFENEQWELESFPNGSYSLSIDGDNQMVLPNMRRYINGKRLNIPFETSNGTPYNTRTLAQKVLETIEENQW